MELECVWNGLFGDSPFDCARNGGEGWYMTARILYLRLLSSCCFEVSNIVGGFWGWEMMVWICVRVSCVCFVRIFKCFEAK